MILVSTLDLFFRRFNSLQKWLDNIEALIRHDSDTSKSHLSGSPVNSELDDNLKSPAPTLKVLPEKHISQFEELHIDRQLLLDENALLKKQLS